MCWGIDSWGNSLVPKGGGALYFPSVTHANRYMTGKDQSIPSPTNKTAICMSKIETSPITIVDFSTIPRMETRQLCSTAPPGTV